MQLLRKKVTSGSDHAESSRSLVTLRRILPHTPDHAVFRHPVLMAVDGAEDSRHLVMTGSHSGRPGFSPEQRPPG